MSESSITPLAQRLAEENNVNWESLHGSGPEGRIIERDVLEYLARVMAGEEDLNPTPEPLPDGLESWDSFSALQETDSWQARSQVDGDAAAVEAVADPIAVDALVAEAGQDSAEADFELSDDIFLFDDADEPAAPALSLQFDDDDSFDLLGGTPEPASEADDDKAGLLDDDFYEDDFLTDLALEDGELDTPEVADVDLSGFGMLGDAPAATGMHDDSDLLDDSYDDSNLWTRGAASEQDSGWRTEAVTEPQHRSLTDYLQDDTPAEGHSLQFGLEAADDDAELDLLTGYSDLGATDELLTTDESFEVDFSELAAAGQEDAVTAAAAVEADSAPPVAESDTAPVAFAHEAELDAAPAAFAHEAEATADAEPVPPLAPLPVAELPLVSHGALLRRHADLTLLVQARQAAGVELRQGEPVSSLPFLLRASARSAHLLTDSEPAADLVTGAALITDRGVQVELVSDAADGSFAELIRLLANSGESAAGQEQTDGSSAAVIACDMSQLELDEAVLHLGSPLLTLGRILSDSEQGTYHSTLTLSGTFDVAAGARFLQAVSELLASPVRLLI